jgi:hypothetical protein
MDKRSRPIEGKLSKRILILRENVRTISVQPAIYYVELLFTTKKRTWIVNSWELPTPERAKEKYDELYFE